MFDTLKTFAAAAAIAAVPMASSALVVTSDEVVSITINDESGLVFLENYIPGGFGFGANPAVLSLLDGGEYSVNTDVIDVAGAPTQGLTVEQTFTNNTSQTFVIESDTVNPAGVLDGVSLTVNTIIGGIATTVDLLANNSFGSDIGTDFTITLAATDVVGTGNFDYTIAAVPVPAAGLLLLSALGAGGVAARRRKS